MPTGILGEIFGRFRWPLVVMVAGLVITGLQASRATVGQRTVSAALDGMGPIPVAAFVQLSHDDGGPGVGGGGAVGGGIGIVGGPVRTVSKKLFNLRDAWYAVVATVDGWFS